MESQYDNMTLAQQWDQFRAAFKSREAFSDYLRVKPTIDENGHRNFWINEAWSWYNWSVFYFGVGFGNWTLGSTMVGIGMSWWQSIVVIFVSQLIASAAMFFASRVGARYHIGYPCVARAVFGMWGSYYYVAARAILACIWLAVQIYTSAALLDCMFHAIFGTSYYNLPNHIPASQGITSRRLMCFFIMWCAHLAMSSLRPYQLNKFFWAKMFMIVPGLVGLFVFCMANTKGQLGSLYSQSTSGSAFGWFFMYAINAGMGNNATYITNQPDMSRWSNSLRGCQWPQVILNPLSTTVSATFGILATSAMNAKWNLSLWNQWDLLESIIEHYWSPGPRFAVALCAFTWSFYFLGLNVSSNMLPFGSDSTMLLPRFLTIPRGQVLALLLSWPLVPWKIEASASIFVSFLSGYGIFMASVASCMMCEYYFLTNGNIFVTSLYDGAKSNKHYYYYRGWNVQAAIAYIVGVAVPFPGFIGTLGASVSTTATNIGHLGWLLSFSISFVVYYCLCKVWPTKNQRLIKEMGLSWEQLATLGSVIEGVEDLAGQDDAGEMKKETEVNEKGV
ncbi:putative Uracil permease-like protein [Seiridium cardinale]|uniref:Uracil permease-like protein n=1 Tax=Seiridium cardinale TaxID=138064 RepID=A0ABR2XSS6_9PEZI